MIDSFTKFGWCYPSIRKDAFSFAKILLKHIRLEGTWVLFHSDNGVEFINMEVDLILNNFGISSMHGRTYHSQSQGQVERFNRTIKTRIRKCFDFNEFNWI
ncbi:Gag-Pol polyprotein [Dictyocoela muelleri]|nr:Gag-Pol polyprotein [Dictyocoela muelleri]